MDWYWFPIGGAVLGVLLQLGKQADLTKAKVAYEQALAALAADSESNPKRIAALDAGRAFARLARRAAGSNGVAIFDEMALQNDLTVRFGKAAQPQLTNEPAANQNAPAPQQLGSVDQLSRLAELRAQGVLTPSEFAVAKKKVLSA